MKIILLLISLSVLINKSNLNEAVYGLTNDELIITESGSFNLAEPLTLYQIIIRPSKEIILNDSFVLSGLNVKLLSAMFIITLSNLKGFELTANPIKKIHFIGLKYDQLIYRITNSELKFFYEKKNLNQNCNKSLFKNSNLDFYLFKSYGIKMDTNVLYSDKMCPLVFQHSYAKLIHFKSLSNAFLFKNILKFQNLSFENDELDSTIEQLNLDCYHYDLTSELLNKHVFQNTIVIDINGPINSIESDLFRSFQKLKLLRIKMQHIRNLIVRDNKWLQSLNPHVYIDFSLRPNPKDLIHLAVTLVLYQMYSNYSYYSYPDEDFCFFRHFPHERLVLPMLAPSKVSRCTCTELFLIFYSHSVSRYIEYYNDFHPGNYYNLQYYADELGAKSFSKCVNDSYSDYIKQCNFTRRKNNCDLEPIKELKREFYFYFSDLYLTSSKGYLLVFFLNRILASVCIFTNMTSIIVLVLSKKITKECRKTYKYLVLHTWFNLVYTLITFMELACKEDVIVCFMNNPIYLRYFKLFVVKFIGNTLKTGSNLSHVLFTLSRYSMMTSSKYKFVSSFNKLSVRKTGVITLMFSLMINIYICFEYALNQENNTKSKMLIFNSMNFSNYYKPINHYDYAQDFHQLDHSMLNTFHFIHIILSDTVYIVLSFVIDLLLFIFIKKQMIMKEKLVFVNMISNDLVKRQKRVKRQAKRSINRISAIIILNGINFLVFRFPSAVVSFYSLIYIYNKTEKAYEPSVIGYIVCRARRFCPQLAELFGSFYYVSYLMQFFILFKLDKNFKESFAEFETSLEKWFFRYKILNQTWTFITRKINNQKIA